MIEASAAVLALNQLAYLCRSCPGRLPHRL